MGNTTQATALTTEQITQLAQQQQQKIEALQAQTARKMNDQPPPFAQGPGTLVEIPEDKPTTKTEPAVNFSTGSKEANSVLGALN